MYASDRMSESEEGLYSTYPTGGVVVVFLDRSLRTRPQQTRPEAGSQTGRFSAPVWKAMMQASCDSQQ